MPAVYNVAVNVVLGYTPAGTVSAAADVALFFMYYICQPSSHIKTFIMGNILYIIAVILVIGWLLGMFAFHVTGGLIHDLLVIAVILIIINVVSGRRGV